MSDIAPGGHARRRLSLIAAIVMVGLGAAGIASFLWPSMQARGAADDGALTELYRRAAPAVVQITHDGELGSGFVVDAKGYIVTNNHVVAGKKEVDVTFLDGTLKTGTVVGSDASSDLAVVKVDGLPNGVTPLELGDSDALRIGQQVIAIGNPLGLTGTMTTGIISGLHRTLPGVSGSFSVPDLIQTDAVINPGNSGGPLFDGSGRVIGVATAIQSGITGLFSGVGLAVSSGLVRQVVPVLIAQGSYQWPWLGVSGNSLDAATARANDLSNTRGAYVHQVIPDGPAAKAGLRGSRNALQVEQAGAIPVGGDIIVALDGHPIDSFDALLIAVARRTKVGQTVRLRVLREGKTIDVPVTLEARPATAPDMGRSQQQRQPRP